MWHFVYIPQGCHVLFDTALSAKTWMWNRDRKVLVSAETETEYSAETECSAILKYSVSAEYSAF